ncbi:MAG: hypothetical protein ACJ789_01975 [Thermomicrobiales bacterium]
MQVDRFLASNEALGLVLSLVLIFIGIKNRAYVREITGDSDRLWRILPKAAFVATAVFIAWTSVFDNWRQLIGLPYRLSQKFPSQRVEYNPPPDGIRTITFILLGASLVLVACLVARHVGGVLIQIILFMAAVTFWAPIFAIRQRFDVNLSLGFEGSPTSPIDVSGYGLWVFMAWSLDIILILMSYILLLAITAVPVTVLLDITRLRQPKVTEEAEPFFASFHERVSSSRRP